IYENILRPAPHTTPCTLIFYLINYALSRFQCLVQKEMSLIKKFCFVFFFFVFFSLYWAMDFTWLMCSLSTLSFNRVALFISQGNYFYP
uniref:Uncharacterized protein n=1 Tax=Sus scrofa TaxID=9823 RepID=A0A8D1H754_PIG